jgi:hypothetical protein
MIQVTHPDASKNGNGRSSLGFDRGERVGIARKHPSRIAAAIDRFVAKQPGFCLGAALSLGIALGWWVKRGSPRLAAKYFRTSRR